jgi:hypothetical protein
MKKRQNISVFLNRSFDFLVSVMRDFRRNLGLLLAGAIA